MVTTIEATLTSAAFLKTYECTKLSFSDTNQLEEPFCIHLHYKLSLMGEVYSLVRMIFAVLPSIYDLSCKGAA